MKNKIIALLLVVILIFSFGFTTYAETQQSFNEVTLSMYCNVSEKRRITGVYSNNNFYVKADDLCDVANGEITEQTEESIVVSCNYGIRNIKIYHTTQNMTEDPQEERLITMPVIEYENTRYYSLLHFLRYLGINVSIEEKAETQLKIFVRYNIFDAIGEYLENNKGNFFWWDEVECTENENLEDKLVNAGVVALINRDSNIFRMMFDAKGIEREALEDALVSILTNEGESYFNEKNSGLDSLNLANDTLGFTADVAGFIVDAYKSDATENLGKFIKGFSTASTISANSAVNFVNAFSTMKQFDSITETQRTLLENTILKYPEDSALLCGEWARLQEATKNVNIRVKDAFANGFEAGNEAVTGIAYDLLQGSVSNGNPVAFAWSGAIFINKLIPYTSNMIDKKTQLYNAYLSSIIQMVAKELLSDAVLDLNNANFMQFNSSAQFEHLTELKNSLILQLKSTLTTREYLIQSEFLEKSYAEEMNVINKQTAELLNKVENCKIVLVGMEPSVTEDLSWMEYAKQTSISNATETTITPAIEPEEAVEIYNSVFSQWQINKENYSCNYYYYGFLDFDFDGVLEMVTTVNMGTGMYSHNKYYRIDPASKTVKEITNNEKKSDGGGFDLSGSTALYKNNQSGELTYYSQDAVRGGGISYGPLWYENNAVYSEWPVGRSSEQVKISENQYDYIHTYYLGNEKISEAEYNTLVENFEKENTNLNLQWETCNGSDIDNATATQRKQLLLNAYKSFRYDGFSFDNIKTEPTNKEAASEANTESVNNSDSSLTVEDAKNIVENAQKVFLKWADGGDYDLTQKIKIGEHEYPLVTCTKEEMKAEICEYMHESYFDYLFKTFYIEQNGHLCYKIGSCFYNETYSVVKCELQKNNNSHSLSILSVHFNPEYGTSRGYEIVSPQLEFIQSGDQWIINESSETIEFFFSIMNFLPQDGITTPETLFDPQEAFLTKDNTSTVILRKGPTESAAEIDTIFEDNEKFYICGSSSSAPDWVFVCQRCYFGWIQKRYVSSSDELSTGKIIDLFTKATALNRDWINWGPLLDYDNPFTYTVNGKTNEYAVIQNDSNYNFSSVDEIKNEFANYFSKELYEQKIDDLYTMIDGKLYGVTSLGRCGDIGGDNIKLTVTSQTATECTFSVTEYFSHEDLQPQTNNYKLKKINGSWVFVEKFYCINSTYSLYNWST